jgi:hypothetical protein
MTVHSFSPSFAFKKWNRTTAMSLSQQFPCSYLLFYIPMCCNYRPSVLTHYMI